MLNYLISLMNSKRHFFASATLITFVLLAGCNTDKLEFDNIELPNYKASHGVILGSAHFSLAELLEDLNDSTLEITENNAKLLSIIYRDTTEFDDIAQVASIDDVTNPGRIEPNLDLGPFPGIDTTYTHTQVLSFDYPVAGGEVLDSIDYIAGTLRFDLESNFNVELSYTFEIYDIIDPSTGDTLVISGVIAPGGTDTQSENLAGFRTQAELQMVIEYDEDNNPTDTTYINRFNGLFTGMLNLSDGGRVNPDETLDYNVTIQDVEYETIYGFFGTKSFDIQSQTVDIAVFEDIGENGFVFKSPEINITLVTSFGVPMGIDLSGISSTNSEGTTVSLMGDVTATPQFTNAPRVNAVGSTTTNIITINSTNSNLADLLSISPNQITIDVAAQTNYNVDSLTRRNFVNYQSRADIYLEMEMPMDLRLQGFTRDFDFDFGIDSAEYDFDEVDTVSLFVKSTNYMPFNGTVDLQVVDADENVLHEILDVLLIASPELPLSGRVEVPNESTVEIKLYDDGLSSLLSASQLKLVLTIDSFDAENETFVKIYSDYSLDLQVSVGAQLDIEL